MIFEWEKRRRSEMSERRDFGSRLAAGSSITRMSGSIARTVAIATALFCPPERWWGGLSRSSSAPTERRASQARSSASR